MMRKFKGLNILISVFISSVAIAGCDLSDMRDVPQDLRNNVRDNVGGTNNQTEANNTEENEENSVNMQDVPQDLRNNVRDNVTGTPDNEEFEEEGVPGTDTNGADAGVRYPAYSPDLK